MKLFPLLITFVFALALTAGAQSPAKAGFKYYGGAAVTTVTVGTAGTGYTSIPTVTFTGGSGAVQATGTSTLKVVGSVTITAGGTGYTVGNVLTVVGGTKSTAATLTVSTVSSGAVTAVTITNAGVYTAIPSNAAATTGAGTGCTVTLGYGVGTVVVVTNGSGYLTAPSVAFAGGAGSSAAATATLGSGATSAIAVKFCEVFPSTDSVISAITFPSGVPLNDSDRDTSPQGPYSGDTSIIGKTLTAGRLYRIYGTSVTFSSGTGILTLR